MNQKLCWDCQKVKHQVQASGSFLCRTCLVLMFEKINKKYKEETMKELSSLERVEQLMNEGLAAKVIAERTDLSISTVRTYQTKIRQEGKTKEKEPETTDSLKEDYVKLRENYAQLEIKNQELWDQNHKLKTEIKEPAEDTEYLALYELEKQKHDALFTYLNLVLSKQGRHLNG